MFFLGAKNFAGERKFSLGKKNIRRDRAVPESHEILSKRVNLRNRTAEDFHG